MPKAGPSQPTQPERQDAAGRQPAAGRGPGGSMDVSAFLHAAADLAAEYLRRCDDPAQPVTLNPPPSAIHRRVPLRLDGSAVDPQALLDQARSLMDLSVRTGSVRFSNQLFSGYDPVAIVGEWLTAVLNASMYTYEVAPAMTLVEREVIAKMGAAAGWSTCEGLFTPGGSLSNLMAMLLARQRLIPDVRSAGVAKARPVVFASAEAHYSVERAAVILGLGSSSVVAVPHDRYGRMRTDALAHAVACARAQGLEPMMVVATAGTTVLGAYDPIEPIADIARREGLWLHVDGAYGASALLSPARRGLMAGVERADSLTWCAHKMLNVPLSASVILVRHRGLLHQCNAVHAEYLYHADGDSADLDTGEMSIQCGRRVDALKVWLAWKARGDAGMAELVETKFRLATRMRQLVRQRDRFELLCDPDPVGGGCNTCFVYHHPSLDGLPPDRRLRALDAATHVLRERVRLRGRVLTNYAPVFGVRAFRHVSANDRATDQDLALILDEIESVAEDLDLAPLAEGSHQPES
ncbi:MAG: pyridoxal-dependent decarboxylase [Phycisphaerales bacterium]|nr:MAG: pyridoxal-dependent decarboxylase [Phycisphaerales bacterium]